MTEREKHRLQILMNPLTKQKERQFRAEFDRLIEKYNRSPTELKTLSLVEKQQDLQEFKVNMAKIAAHSKKREAFRREKPLKPEPSHTH